MKNLIELTITFPESETQTMILEKGSEAYKQMIDYAEINEGVTSEKPYLNEIDHSIINSKVNSLISNYATDFWNYYISEKNNTVSIHFIYW